MVPTHPEIKARAPRSDRGGRHKTRRRPSRAKPKSTPVLIVAGVEAHNPLGYVPPTYETELVVRLIEASPLPDATTKRLLAEGIALLRLQIADIKLRLELGTTVSRESVTLAGCVNSVKKHLETLGLTKIPDEGGVDFIGE